MSAPRLLLSLLLLALALPGPALAKKKKAAEEEAVVPTNDSAVLVFGHPPSQEDREPKAIEALQSRFEEDEPLPSRILSVEDWMGSARFRIGGSATEETCNVAKPKVKFDASKETEIEAVNRAANQLLNDLEPEQALQMFTTAQARLPCQDVYLDQDSFWESYFYAGIAAFYTGDSQAARAHFRQAAAIAPERQWDASYPPEPQSTFLSAVQDVVARPKGKVWGDLRDTNYREVWLDGRPLDLTKAFEQEVYPGKHLVQAVDDAGKWATWYYDIREGASITLFSAKGLQELVLDGADGVLRSVATSTLAKKARDEDLEDVFIVRLDEDGEPTVVWQFTRRGAVWSRLERSETGQITRTQVAAGEEDLTPEERNRRAFLREPDYRASVAVGFKFMSIWRCGAADASDISGISYCSSGHKRKNDYLGGLIGIDVNLIRGLNLDFRFGTTVTDMRLGGTLLPEFSVGMRYRFLQGVMQPFLAVSADFFFGLYRDTETSPDQFSLFVGPLGYGGIEFELPDGFRITLEGGGGIILTGDGSAQRWPMAHGMFAIGRFLP